MRLLDERVSADVDAEGQRAVRRGHDGSKSVRESGYSQCSCSTLRRLTVCLIWRMA